MSSIHIATFKGEVPRVTPRLLDEASAEIAINCDLQRGHLEPMKGMSQHSTLPQTSRSVFINDYTTLSSAENITYTKSAVLDASGDKPMGVVYATGGSYPVQIFTASTTNTHVKLELPRPEHAPYCMGSKTPEDTDVIDRSCAYVYTYVRKLANGVVQQESGTSPASNVIDIVKDEVAAVWRWIDNTGAQAVAPSGYGITHWRIYRTVSGYETTEYQFVVELPINDYGYTDRISDSDLPGEVCDTMLWDTIPTNAKGMILTDNGIYAAFRGNELLISEPFVPYAFPEAYRITVEDNIVALAHTDNTIIVLTEGRPYLAIGSEPENLQINHLPIEQACVSAKSVAEFPGGAIYASPDGLMLFTANDQHLCSHKVWTREQWQALDPTKILATWHDNRYVAFFEGTNRGFVFVPDDGQVVWIEYPSSYKIYALYHHSKDDCVYVSTDISSAHRLMKFENGEPMQYTWKSKRFFSSRLITLSALRIMGEHESPTEVELYAGACAPDDEPRCTMTVSDDRTKRTTITRSERLYSIEVKGSATIYELRIGTSVEDVESE